MRSSQRLKPAQGVRPLRSLIARAAGRPAAASVQLITLSRELQQYCEHCR